MLTEQNTGNAMWGISWNFHPVFSTSVAKRENMQQVSWVESILALFLILLPTVSCLFVRKRWIVQYQRELLTCSLGTIFSIVFVDLIPDLIEDAPKEPGKKLIRLYYSLSIFAGIAFAFLTNEIHEITEGSNNKQV